MKTRDRILQASLAMFNEQGERNVSTNHIAAALGISPGNLYYHFSNKAEIIFDLFSTYRDIVGSSMVIPMDRPLTFDDKVHYFEIIFQNMWNYRFLHRDLEHLLKESETLRKEYFVFSSTTVAMGKAIVKGMVESGLVIASDDEIDALMLNLWVILTSWASFLQSIEVQKERPSDMDPWALKRGIYQIICLIEPYATDIARKELPALKAAYLGDFDTDPLSLFRGRAIS